MSLSDNAVGMIFAAMCLIIGSLVYSQRLVFTDSYLHIARIFSEVNK